MTLISAGIFSLFIVPVFAGGPPVLVEPGRAWTYEASLNVGGPPVLVEPGRAWTYEASVNVGGPPVLVEPGRAWTYEGSAEAGGAPVLVEQGRAWTYEGKKAGGEAAPATNNLRIRYVVLPKAESESDTTVVRTLEPAAGAASGKECPKDVALLKLRSDLCPKSVECVQGGENPVAKYFNFAPIPPAYAKVLVGSRREDSVKIETPSFKFSPGRVWTATYTDDGHLEVVCTAKALPAAAEGAPTVKLESFREVYRVDPMNGVTVTFQRTWRVRETDKEPQDVTVSLKLVDWKDLTEKELEAEKPTAAKI